jgi:hypothetical protein
VPGATETSQPPGQEALNPGAQNPDPTAELPPVGTLAAGEILTVAHLTPEAAAPYFSIEPITPEVFARMEGRSWQAGAISIDQLRYLRTLYFGFEFPEECRAAFCGESVTLVGEIIVNEAVAEQVLEIFKELYDAQYRIESMVLIDNFSADDTASMNANNTSGFNHRYIAGTTTLSNHAKGLAIDLNPVQNPWVSNGNVDPPAGEPYADRSNLRPHMINHDDLAFQLFTEHGFTWGGDWRNPRDYQHFEKN